MTARAVRIGTFAAVLVAAIAARDGAAQTTGEARRVFAGAVLAGNIDHSTDNSPLNSTGPARSGGALAVGASFGGTFADRWSVQVEGEFPTSDQTAVDRQDLQYGGQTWTSLRRTTYRTPTVAVLFGVHWRLPDRVDVAFQFGPCLRNERQTYEYHSLANGTDYSDTGRRNVWLLGASVGGDVAVNVTSRVAVVGQLRVHMQSLYVEDFLLGTVVRPAIGVRVRF